ncbi:Fasciclin-like arabinogalactan protein 2, partial [Cucurbita argyrosperma subsp. argyrosperma]
MYPFIIFLLLFPSLFNSQPTNSVLPPAPAPAPTTHDPTQLNLTRLLSTAGCTAFAQALANSTAQKAFNDVVQGGLTVFCPSDVVWDNFSSKFKNLTLPAKTSLLEFHAVPIYMPLPVLKSNNGVTNTLATDGAHKFDFTVQNDGQDVTILTTVVTAKVGGTGFDEAPLAIFLVDCVLEPDELFSVHAVAPASAKVKGRSDMGSSPPSAESPDYSPADHDGDGDGNSAVRVDGGEFYLAAVVLTTWIGFLQL